MKRTQLLHQIAEILRRRRDALRRSLSGDLEQVTLQDKGTVGDSIDAAHDTDYREITSGIAAVESRELAHIERALARLRAGHYGTCESCDKKIPVLRLKALPYATLCIDCQKKQEDGEKAGWSTERRSRGLPDVDPDAYGDDVDMEDIKQLDDLNHVS